MDWFDASLYPDVERPGLPATQAERVDYVARVCSAWDFGLLPEAQTVAELARPAWREAVDACNLLTSVSYHVLRSLHALPETEFLGTIPAYVRDDPNLTHV